MTDSDINKWIAGRACEALAQLSTLYDPEGKEAEALMCDWSGTPDGAGEQAAQRVVTRLADLVNLAWRRPTDVAPSELGTLKCPACGGDGYHKGPRLGDEPCTMCGGTGKVSDTPSPHWLASAVNMGLEVFELNRGQHLTDEVITPEMRERADEVVARMRARWAAKDVLTDQANRAFDMAFRNALRQPRSPKR